MRVSPTKMDEPIEVPFSFGFVWAHALGGGPDFRPWEEAFWGSILACPDLPQSFILSLIRKGQQRCGLWLPVL